MTAVTSEQAGGLTAPKITKSRYDWNPARVIGFTLMVFIAFLFLVPLAWMISTSLKSDQALVGNSFFPPFVDMSNYQKAFTYGNWGVWTRNTLIITVGAVVGQVVASALVAYSFARLRWPGRDMVFGLVLATMMLPGVVTLFPQFILFSRLPNICLNPADVNTCLQGSRNWINTFLPFIVPAFAGSAFNIFLLRQFMRGIPNELSEAAKVDGASELRIWWSIVMPLSKPAIATIAIFTFQGAWQDFERPLIFLQSERWYTLQLGLRQFDSMAGGAWNQLMAASLVVMLPVLVVFLLFQQYFIEGISISGFGGR
jgi:multiple sugar transport system permease protein